MSTDADLYEKQVISNLDSLERYVKNKDNDIGKIRISSFVAIIFVILLVFIIYISIIQNNKILLIIISILIGILFILRIYIAYNEIGKNKEDYLDYNDKDISIKTLQTALIKKIEYLNKIVNKQLKTPN